MKYNVLHIGAYVAPVEEIMRRLRSESSLTVVRSSDLFHRKIDGWDELFGWLKPRHPEAAPIAGVFSAFALPPSMTADGLRENIGKFNHTILRQRGGTNHEPSVYLDIPGVDALIARPA